MREKRNKKDQEKAPLTVRKILGRIGLGMLYFVVVLVAGGFVGGFFWLYTSLPIIEGTLEVANGPSTPVEILRDKHTVPHIFAENQEDAYFGLGFVHAQDRLWQMEMMRRLASGRLAEVAGRKALASDRFMRTLGFHRLAEKQYAALDGPVRRALDAYAAGVNAWIGATSGAFPPEFTLTGIKPEPWKPTDSLLWGKLMAFRLSGNWRDELLRARLAERLSDEQIAEMWPAYPADGPVSTKQAAAWDGLALDALAAALPISRADLGGASNGWAVTGRYTETGKPILANDPHLGFAAPVLWYLARIEAPGLHVTGATVPGVPFTILGHNRRIAWGMMSTQSDLQDLFVETVDPDDPGRYLTPDGSRPFATRTEVIAVRGGDDITLTVRTTRHGPVISDVLAASGTAGGGKVLALAATFLADDDLTPQAIYRLNRAQGWHDFLAAMTDFHSPQQNFVYADVDGAIGFLAPGRVPIRRSGRGRVPGNGAGGATDWTGFIPFDELPRSLNPPSGRIVNANNRIVDDDYPHYITDDWAAPYRARRIIERLDEGKRQTLDSSARIQLDTLSLMARHLLPKLLDIKAPSAAAEQALAMMRAWDGAMDRERAEPLIFNAWLRELNRGVYGDELGPLLADYWSLRPRFMAAVLDGRGAWCDDVGTPIREDCPGMIAAALTRALASLAASFGADMETWSWGAAHQASFAHTAFAKLPVLGRYTNLAIESGGGNYTVNRGATRITNEADPFANVHGAGFRAVYDLADLSRSRFMIATGQSGNPMSPFYGDLLKAWRDGEALNLGTDRLATRRKAKGVLMLISTVPED